MKFLSDEDYNKLILEMEMIKKENEQQKKELEKKSVEYKKLYNVFNSVCEDRNLLQKELKEKKQEEIDTKYKESVSKINISFDNLIKYEKYKKDLTYDDFSKPVYNISDKILMGNIEYLVKIFKQKSEQIGFTSDEFENIIDNYHKVMTIKYFLERNNVYKDSLNFVDASNKQEIIENIENGVLNLNNLLASFKKLFSDFSEYLSTNKIDPNNLNYYEEIIEEFYEDKYETSISVKNLSEQILSAISQLIIKIEGKESLKEYLEQINTINLRTEKSNIIEEIKPEEIQSRTL